MPIERPTFHESWYRVAELHPRLRTTVQISRQHFRGQAWHVVQDHSNNAFFRLAEPAYRFIGLLDGKRTVGEAWNTANEQLGDDAPTQGEVIQLLGQLYTQNLLQADVPADVHTLFSRFKKRKQREITTYLMNIMFSRIPIFDPDRFLNATLPIFGWIFSPIGLCVWLVLIALGIHSITNVSNFAAKLGSQASGVLDPENLIILYVGFALIKACHEMGHAISCKKFGKQAGTGGEVHIIGIMLLVFTPVPYVDASSSWALQNKWHRIIVGAAGMWVELAIASIAAIVWANSGDSGTPWVNHFAYNVMFVAGFSTIVFNANPLLRYDGYYILSDFLEIPNLAQRGKEYIYYVVKRYIWNVRQARSPAHGRSEKFWLFTYAIASFIMRIFVTFSIMFYLSGVLNGTLIILAAGMTIAGLITWVCVPAGKFIHYLVTSGELSRVRGRAMLSSAATVLALLWGIGFFPIADHSRAQGVVEPAIGYVHDLFPGDEGVVMQAEVVGRPAADPLTKRLSMPTVQVGDTILVTNKSDLQRDLEEAQAALVQAQVKSNLAFAQEQSAAALSIVGVKAAERRVKDIKDEIAKQTLIAPISGVLVVPEMETKQFAFVKKTDRVGMVADLHHLMIRAVAKNELGGLLKEELDYTVEIRVDGRPDILLTGHVFQSDPAGSQSLPSPALGYQMGGEFNTAPDDRQGTKTVEHFWEVRIADLKMVSGPKDLMTQFENTGDVPLLPGQRVVVRFVFHPKPIAAQVWTKLRQVFQQRFQM